MFIKRRSYGFLPNYYITFSFLGLVNGIFAAVLFRLKRFYLYGIAGALISCGTVQYYVWYALAYPEYGLAAHFGAYFACALMVADIMLVLPLFLLMMIGTVRFIRRYAQIFGAAVMALSLFIGVYGSVDGEMKEEAERYTIAAEELPEAFDGLKVAQITDTHIGPYYRNADLANDLERSKAEGADVVMLTGDLIDDIRVMPETAKILNSRAVLFPYGIIYVRGNHELYKDPDYIENELRKTSVKILDNSHVALQKDGALLYVAGVDYPEMRGEGRAELMAQMVRDAFDGIPEDSAKIFLAHHSDFIDAGFENRAFLTLTGHTHGTQFGIFGKPMITPFKYTRGMYSDGKHCGYVSRGSGGWFPFRFDTSRELTIFTLKKK